MKSDRVDQFCSDRAIVGILVATNYHRDRSLQQTSVGCLIDVFLSIKDTYLRLATDRLLGICHGREEREGW